jgi:hypothetical protein
MRNVSLAAFAAALFCVTVACPAQGGGKDKQPRVEEFSIHTPNGWLLSCRPDGSGSLGYGSSAGDFVPFKAGTIDFAAALKQLRGIADKKGALGTHFAVAFREKGAATAVSVYTKDAKAVLGLFERARKGAARQLSERFDQLWRDRPPSLKAE